MTSKASQSTVFATPETMALQQESRQGREVQARPKTMPVPGAATVDTSGIHGDRCLGVLAKLFAPSRSRTAKVAASEGRLIRERRCHDHSRRLGLWIYWLAAAAGGAKAGRTRWGPFAGIPVAVVLTALLLVRTKTVEQSINAKAKVALSGAVRPVVAPGLQRTAGPIRVRPGWYHADRRTRRARGGRRTRRR